MLVTYTTEGVFSWKRRTVASSSGCNFFGVATTKADAESTSPANNETDNATEAQSTNAESTSCLKLLCEESSSESSEVTVSLLPRAEATILQTKLRRCSGDRDFAGQHLETGFEDEEESESFGGEKKNVEAKAAIFTVLATQKEPKFSNWSLEFSNTKIKSIQNYFSFSYVARFR